MHTASHLFGTTRETKAAMPFFYLGMIALIGVATAVYVYSIILQP